jgi:hypothetical protein
MRLQVSTMLELKMGAVLGGMDVEIMIVRQVVLPLIPISGQARLLKYNFYLSEIQGSFGSCWFLIGRLAQSS